MRKKLEYLQNSEMLHNKKLHFEKENIFQFFSFPPVGLEASEFNPSWFYEAIADLYSDNLPAQAATSMATYGHYSFLMRPGVNFTNVLCTAFTYVSCACSFFVLMF